MRESRYSFGEHGDYRGPREWDEFLFATTEEVDPTTGGYIPDIMYGGGYTEEGVTSLSGGRSGYVITERGVDHLELLSLKTSRSVREGVVSNDPIKIGRDLEYLVLDYISIAEPGYSLIVDRLGSFIEERYIRSVVRYLIERKYIVGPKV